MKKEDMTETSREAEGHERGSSRPLREGDVIDAVVTNYIPGLGAIFSIGDVEALLHDTDMSWRSVESILRKPMNVGEQRKLVVLQVNPTTKRASVGLKQLHPDPWLGVEERYEVGRVVRATVSFVTFYGAFVEPEGEEGLEALLHITDISWTRWIEHPSEVLSPGQTIDVKVLSIDPEQRRMVVGLKQMSANPFQGAPPIRSVVNGTVVACTSAGMTVDLGNGLHGFVSQEDVLGDGTAHRPGDGVNVWIRDIQPRSDGTYAIRLQIEVEAGGEEHEEEEVE